MALGRRLRRCLALGEAAFGSVDAIAHGEVLLRDSQRRHGPRCRPRVGTLPASPLRSNGMQQPRRSQPSPYGRSRRYASASTPGDGELSVARDAARAHGPQRPVRSGRARRAYAPRCPCLPELQEGANSAGFWFRPVASVGAHRSGIALISRRRSIGRLQGRHVGRPDSVRLSLPGLARLRQCRLEPR